MNLHIFIGGLLTKADFGGIIILNFDGYNESGVNMKRRLLVSTGTMVGRSNGYNYKRALNVISELYNDGFCSGLELMMLPFYYDKIDDVVSSVAESGVEAATIHCEKEIGTMLSDAAVLLHDGKESEAEEKRREALRLFEINLETAQRLKIRRMVLHLWGGIASDGYVEYNIAALPEMSRMAEGHNVRLLVENVPSNHADPKSNWKKVLPYLGDGGLIFDTRFGKLHEQTAEILTDPELISKIEHIHVSDFTGGYRNFKALRPILHPREGVIDFGEVAALLDKINYSGTVTLESPIMVGEELDISKIKSTLAYLKELFGAE